MSGFANWFSGGVAPYLQNGRNGVPGIGFTNDGLSKNGLGRKHQRLTLIEFLCSWFSFITLVVFVILQVCVASEVKLRQLYMIKQEH